MFFNGTIPSEIHRTFPDEIYHDETFEMLAECGSVLEKWPEIEANHSTKMCFGMLGYIYIYLDIIYVHLFRLDVICV